MQHESRTSDRQARFTVTVDLDSINDRTVPLEDWDSESAIPTGNSSGSAAIADTHDYRLSGITMLSTSVAIKNGKPVTGPIKAKYMGYGVVRLFREFITVDGSEVDPKTSGSDKEIEVESDDTTVAMVAVPNYFSPTDVLAFIGEGVIKEVSHFRMVKSDNPNRFMVLMKFRSNESARSFQDSYNGRLFNSMESESCHTIFVKSVLFQPLNAPNSTGIPYLLEDPFTLQVKKSKLEGTDSLVQGSVVKELPTCPVCLERMDSDVTGLITISCQHTFHCKCLSKWRDDTCPVCRYSNLSLDALRRSDSRESIQRCSSCGASQNLWICLICGNVGCGRYNSKHAIEHYESTNHCFSMDISTQRVWDYAGDNYVHRLLQNESDGKLVELPSVNSCTSLERMGQGSSSDELKDKNRDYSIEYSNVLLSQLESQREYYESRLAESADFAAQAIQQRDEMEARLNGLESNFHGLQEQVKNLQSASLVDHSKEVKLAKDLARSFEKKLRDEQALVDSLSKNLEAATLEKNELKKTNEQLQEEVNDLMLHLTTQAKLQDAPDDVKNGQIVVRPAGRQSTRNTRRK